jgi:hypothetical protein
VPTSTDFANSCFRRRMAFIGWVAV